MNYRSHSKYLRGPNLRIFNKSHLRECIKSKYASTFLKFCLKKKKKNPNEISVSGGLDLFFFFCSVLGGKVGEAGGKKKIKDDNSCQKQKTPKQDPIAELRW